MNRKRSKTRKTKRKQNKRRGRSRRTRYKKKGGLSHVFGKVPVWRTNKAANTYRRGKKECAEHWDYNTHLPKWGQSLSEQEIKNYEQCKKEYYDRYNSQNKHDNNNDKTYQTQVNYARMRGRDAQLAAISVDDMSLDELKKLVQDGYIYD
jgi:hypothetical protein